MRVNPMPISKGTIQQRKRKRKKRRTRPWENQVLNRDKITPTTITTITEAKTPPEIRASGTRIIDQINDKINTAVIESRDNKHDYEIIRSQKETTRSMIVRERDLKANQQRTTKTNLQTNPFLCELIPEVCDEGWGTENTNTNMEEKQAIGKNRDGIHEGQAIMKQQQQQQMGASKRKENAGDQRESLEAQQKQKDVIMDATSTLPKNDALCVLLPELCEKADNNSRAATPIISDNKNEEEKSKHSSSSSSSSSHSDYSKAQNSNLVRTNDGLRSNTYSSKQSDESVTSSSPVFAPTETLPTNDTFSDFSLSPGPTASGDVFDNDDNIGVTVAEVTQNNETLVEGENQEQTFPPSEDEQTTTTTPVESPSVSSIPSSLTPTLLPSYQPTILPSSFLLDVSTTQVPSTIKEQDPVFPPDSNLTPSPSMIEQPFGIPSIETGSPSANLFLSTGSDSATGAGDKNPTITNSGPSNLLLPNLLPSAAMPSELIPRVEDLSPLEQVNITGSPYPSDTLNPSLTGVPSSEDEETVSTNPSSSQQPSSGSIGPSLTIYPSLGLQEQNSSSSLGPTTSEGPSSLQFPSASLGPTELTLSPRSSLKPSLSVIPSEFPSSVPTNPTSMPTSSQIPSEVPLPTTSQQPSTSGRPSTYFPSQQPSSTLEPSDYPSYSPSTRPSQSHKPSITSLPSYMPTITPYPSITPFPTLYSSSSTFPSFQPSEIISHVPSFDPTMTSVPTITIAPSLHPTNSPWPTMTSQPTENSTMPPSNTLSPTSTASPTILPPHACPGWHFTDIIVQVDFAYQIQTTSIAFLSQDKVDQYMINTIADRILKCKEEDERRLQVSETLILRLQYPDPASLVGACKVSAPDAKACWYIETTVLVTALSDDEKYEQVVQSRLLSSIQNLDIPDDVVPNAISFELVSFVADPFEIFPVHPAGIVGFSIVCLFAVFSVIVYMRAAKSHSLDDITRQGDNSRDGDGSVGSTRSMSAPEKRPLVFNVDEEENRSVIDFNFDKKEEMTWARRIALANMKKKWYNPQSVREKSRLQLVHEQNKRGIEDRPAKISKAEIPSLAKAWAFFEHNTLPRHLIDDEGKYDLHDLTRAVPGESRQPSKLYDPLRTPLSQMGDFGLGVGIYFSTLQAIIFLTLMAGILNLQNFVYFASPEYSDGQAGLTGLQAIIVKGSAVCTRSKWVACDECKPEDFSDLRFFTSESAEGESLTFALKNQCEGATNQQGMVHFASLIFVVFGIGLIHIYQKQKEIDFDEDEQTTQDYSVQIHNPPPDASDPKEWRTFFKENFDGAHATVVTTALKNEDLIRTLRHRREVIRNIELMVDPGTSLLLPHLSKLAAKMDKERGILGRLKGLLIPDVPEYYSMLTELEAKIKLWCKLDFPVTNVFVSFEQESDQRRVLHALSIGHFYVHKNATEKVKSQHLFRGNLVLKISEPEEPNTIRWADLNVSIWEKWVPLLMTTLCSIATIAMIAFLVRFIHNRSTAVAAIAIAMFNGVFPRVAKFLTNFERHASEGLTQTSFYFKIAFFRWVNSAVIITAITPFTATLEPNDGLIISVYSIFFAEIVYANAIQLFDFPGHFHRHILAPRTKSQDAMNLKMVGFEVDLAERYTKMTMLLFLALWFSSIFPGAFFMCGFALTVIYFADKFSIMRTWKRLPNLGTRISQFSRKYFFSMAIVAMALVSSYIWSGFPYDNLCRSESTVGTNYYGEHSWELQNGIIVNVSLAPGDFAYTYCPQGYYGMGAPAFPAFSSWQHEGEEWMTEEQALVVDRFGWAGITVSVLVIFGFAWSFFRGVIQLFKGNYKPSGDDMDIGFSDVPGITAYVPEIISPMFPYPLIACKGFDPKIVEWHDPDRPHSYYDLTEDAIDLTGDTTIRDRHVFSSISHCYPGHTQDVSEEVASKTNKESSIFPRKQNLGTGIAKHYGKKVARIQYHGHSEKPWNTSEYMTETVPLKGGAEGDNNNRHSNGVASHSSVGSYSDVWSYESSKYSRDQMHASEAAPVKNGEMSEVRSQSTSSGSHISGSGDEDTTLPAGELKRRFQSAVRRGLVGSHEHDSKDGNSAENGRNNEARNQLKSALRQGMQLQHSVQPREDMQPVGIRNQREEVSFHHSVRGHSVDRGQHLEKFRAAGFVVQSTNRVKRSLSPSRQRDLEMSRGRSMRRGLSGRHRSLSPNGYGSGYARLPKTPGTTSARSLSPSVYVGSMRDLRDHFNGPNFSTGISQTTMDLSIDLGYNPNQYRRTTKPIPLSQPTPLEEHPHRANRLPQSSNRMQKGFSQSTRDMSHRYLHPPNGTGVSSSHQNEAMRSDFQHYQGHHHQLPPHNYD